MAENEKFGIIILTHGPMAQGLLESSQMLFGEAENVTALGLLGDEAPADFAATVEAALQLYPQGALVLVDLFGGTPCNTAMIQAKKMGKALPLVAGVNMPMLISVLNGREMYTLEETIKEAESSGVQGVVNVTPKLEELLAGEG